MACTPFRARIYSYASADGTHRAEGPLRRVEPSGSTQVVTPAARSCGSFSKWWWRTSCSPASSNTRAMWSASYTLTS